MFATADWTQPTTGGLLSEVIMKEEAQLREPKPRVKVLHPWNADGLEHRESLWKDVEPQAGADLAQSRSRLGMSIAQDGGKGHSRARMMELRKTEDALGAMQRQAESDKKLSTEKSSPASLFTADFLQQLRPSYMPNEVYATETSSQLLGMGAARMQHSTSRYGRAKPFPPVSTSSRNDAGRGLMEVSRAELDSRPRPWRSEPRPPSTPDTLVPRAAGSSYCTRPGDIPLCARARTLPLPLPLLLPLHCNPAP